MLRVKYLFTLLIVFFILINSNKGIAQNNITHSKQIPILGWYSIPAEQTSLSRYEELKQAGITHSFTFFKDEASVKRALKVAQKAGIKLIISCPELKSETEKTVKEFMNNPAVAGYFLTDEPGPKEFDELGKWVKKVRSIDDTHFCYINLLPNYANMEQLGMKNYREYVHKFIEEVPVKLLTFDFYPIVGDTIRESWYKNLEIFSDEAQKAGKPFWAFALTTSHASYPIPTLAQLRLQVYSNLAYGAQGIEYFTYWTPESDTWDFHHGPITLKNKRSEVYDRIKVINKEIKNLSGVFLGAKVVSVSHTGDVIPPGTKRLNDLPDPIKNLSTGGSGAIVSVLKKENYSFLIVVNRNFKRSMPLSIQCDPDVMKILKDGSAVPANAYMDTLEIAPGDLAIYRWVKNK